MDTIQVENGSITIVWRDTRRIAVIAPDMSLLFEVEPRTAVAGMAWVAGAAVVPALVSEG